MKSLFTAYPMLRVLLLWLPGIIINYYFKISTDLVLFFTIGAIIVCLFAGGPLKISFLTWILLMIVSILYNQFFFTFKHEPIPPITASVVRVSSLPKEKPKSWEVEAEVLYWKSKGVWETPLLPWKLKVYFSKKIAKPNLGQIWFLSDSLKPFEAPQFPFEKNWADYFKEKGFAGLFFVHKRNSKLLKVGAVKLGHEYFKTIRNRLLQGFSGIPTRANREVAEAMVLGETDGIDEDLKRAYTNLGAVHILSVSGMHLGILFWVLNAVLAGLRRLFPILKVPSILLVLGVIWSYAGITGFSAPVLRASWVFSFILFAKLVNRPIYAINLLATSCFILLVFNPLDLFNIGFQLSYLAVLGILVYQKSIQNWFTFSGKKRWHWPIKILWESTSLAVSAQLFTFPLVIYYFHQFPQLGLYFLLNPLLMLLSTIGLVLSFALIALHPLANILGIKPLNDWLGNLVDFVFEVMHQIMRYFSGTQFPVYSFVHLPFWVMMLVYFFLAFFLLWCKTRRQGFLWVGNAFLLVLCWYYSVGVQDLFGNKSQIRVGEFREEWVGYRLENRQLYVYGPPNLIQNKSWFTAHLTPLAANYAVLDTHLIKEKPRPIGPGFHP